MLDMGDVFKNSFWSTGMQEKSEGCQSSVKYSLYVIVEYN